MDKWLHEVWKVFDLFMLNNSPFVSLNAVFFHVVCVFNVQKTLCNPVFCMFEYGSICNQSGSGHF